MPVAPTPDQPRHLYRYLSLADATRIDWARRLIVDQQLYLSRPSQLNDPFDCQIRFSFAAKKDEARRYWRRFIRTKPAREHGDRRKAEQLVELTQTPEGRSKLEEAFLREVDKHTGLACFASSAANALMWSYYSDGHRGIVVRFDMHGLKIVTRGGTVPFVLPVSYCPDYPVINYYRDKKERLTKLLGSKAQGWAHEEEWRVIVSDHVGYVRVGRTVVDGIVLGLRTSPKHEQLIRGWIAESNEQIEVLRAKPMRRSFALEVGPA
jgi:hypothetical protein